MNEKTRYRKAFDDLPENIEIDWDRISFLLLHCI